MRKIAWILAMMLCLTSMTGMVMSVSATAPNVNFTASVTSGTYPLSVNFTGISSSNITNWLWDFDYDGLVDATTQNASHTYTAAGSYTVQLGVKDSLGVVAQITKNDYIVVGTPALPATSSVTIHGKYTDGSLWNGATPSTLYVNTSKYVSNASGYFLWTAPSPGLVSGSFGFYITLYWKFNGETLREHLIGSVSTDHSYVYQAGIGGMITNGNTSFMTDTLDFAFDEGDGNYTLLATMNFHSLDGYARDIDANVYFNCTVPGLFPHPHISSLFIQAAGMAGILAMILALPMFFFMTSRFNFLFGISTLAIMALVGWVLFNTFVLNSGSV